MIHPSWTYETENRMKETGGPSKRRRTEWHRLHGTTEGLRHRQGPVGKPLTIFFTTDEFRYLETEIYRLSQHAIIYRILGSRPDIHSWFLPTLGGLLLQRQVQYIGLAYFPLKLG